MSARVIPFRDPDAPLEGEAREAALALFREGLKAIALQAVCEAFSAACEIPGCGKLSGGDAVSLFIEAMRRQLDKADQSSGHDRRERARALALEALRLVEEELAALAEEHPDRYDFEMAHGKDPSTGMRDALRIFNELSMPFWVAVTSLEFGEWLLSEIQSEREWDRAFARSQDLLARLAKEAVAEHRRGQTEELDPDKL